MGFTQLGLETILNKVLILFQHITRTEGEVKLDGANASEEACDDEGTDSATESGVDVVLNHRLAETGFGTKKEYTKTFQTYVKRVVKYLEDNEMADQVDEFKTNVTKVFKELLGKFKDLQFYTGMLGIQSTQVNLTGFQKTSYKMFCP